MTNFVDPFKVNKMFKKKELTPLEELQKENEELEKQCLGWMELYQKKKAKCEELQKDNEKLRCQLITILTEQGCDKLFEELKLENESFQRLLSLVEDCPKEMLLDVDKHLEYLKKKKVSEILSELYEFFNKPRPMPYTYSEIITKLKEMAKKAGINGVEIWGKPQ